MNPFEQAQPFYQNPIWTPEACHPLGPSRQDPHYQNAWVQPWSDGILRMSRKPGTLVIMDDHFAREDPTGQYVSSTARPLEGWGLAAKECLRSSAPRDPRFIAALAIGAIKVLRTPTGKLAALAAEAATFFTPVIGDEVGAPAVATATIIAGGVMAVRRQRGLLNGTTR
jgi:hypothetical protein